MTWSMHQTDCDFKMAGDGLAAALAALQKAFTQMDVQGTSIFADAMRHCSWSVSLAAAGNVTGIFFEGQNWGEDEELFDAISPWVEAGSFIEMRGEDGDLWRWIFDGKSCKQVSPETVWPSDTQPEFNVVAQIILEDGGELMGLGVIVKDEPAMWCDADDGFITAEEESRRGNGRMFDSVEDACKKACTYIAAQLKKKGW